MPSQLPTRSPLEDTTNEYRTPTPSPPLPSAKKGPILRHKASQHALHPRLDSSESYPSPHNSIYEASIARVNGENITWYDAKDWVTPSKPEKDKLSSWQADSQEPWVNERASWEDTVLDSSGNAVPVSFLKEPSSPKNHVPHKLFPITEQNSLATLRPGASSSTLKGRLSSSTIRAISPGLKGKKRRSFSLSDLPPSPSPHPVEKTPSPPSSPSTFPTPMEPHQPPPLRIPTPPGLPTFNAPEASNYRLPPPTIRFRDRFRSPTAAEREWMMQTVGLPKGVIMRGEGGVLVRGKFTPIRSGHFPPQRHAHPLLPIPSPTTNQGRPAPRPVVLNQRHVRFTGPAIEPHSPTGHDPISPTIIGGENSRKGKQEKTEKVLKRLYWVLGCCGLCEAWDLSNQHGHDTTGQSGRVRGVAPLLVGGFRAREQ